jgi:hypothetical protein
MNQAYVEMALGFAVSILESTQGKSDKERITHAVRRALSRDPSDREIDVLLGLLNEQSERLKSDASIAKSLVSQAPQMKSPINWNPMKWVPGFSWPMLCSILTKPLPKDEYTPS